ncbi:Replication factor A protein 2 [Lithohypha guttulata]|uniref:Replication factor A protein 2 n=1 Tax=Lithohypha guttulata TaxID=1690604 RepID=A0AAN7SXN3_9EURO|nr:Replication factor A protein 2 [Lithohypha guttulata]
MDYNGYSGNNYNTTSYGAQGAANGGGFMGGEVQSSPAGAKSGYGKDTVRPATVKQILRAEHPHPDAEFKIDGDIVTQLTFVGQIRNISTQATNITYKVDDGTDIIEVKQWLDSEANQDQMDMDTKPKLVEDSYCRVWGRLRAFHDKRHIQAHIIRPITDYNEINYHLLEATAMHLFFKHGPPNGAAGNDQKAGQNGQTNGNAAETVGGVELPKHLSPRAVAVYKYLRNSPQSNEGQHVQLIASNTGMEVDAVFRAAEELVEAGLTFTTVDESTWAVLDF